MLDAPPRPATRVPPMDLGRLVLLFARELLVPITAEELKDLTPDEGLARVLSEGIRARRVPRDISFQDARRYLRLMETTVEASRRYHIDRAYPGTLTIFAGQELNAGLDGSWDEVPTSRETIPVPGDHRSMFEQPHVEVLAVMLRESLDRAFEI
jgi:thioesterase domain-containing protein